MTRLNLPLSGKIFVKIVVSALLVCVFTSEYVLCSGKTAAEFLLLEYGNRPAALGGAFTARAEGPDALFYNTAGLARSGINEARAAYNIWLEGTGYGYLSFLLSAPFGGAGFGARYFNSGSMTRRRMRDEDSGSYSMVSMAFDAGMGINFSQSTRGGFSLTVLNEKIDDESMMGFAFSAGAQYDVFIETEGMAHYLQFGLSAENIGPPAGYHTDTFPLPFLLRAAGSDTILDGRLSGELGLEFIPVEESLTICMGLEFSPLYFLDFRAGYRIPDTGLDFPRGFSMGLGFVYHDERMDYIFDYGFTPMGYLGMGHRLGLGVRF